MTGTNGTELPAACTTGLVGQIGVLVPDCIYACPDSCRSLELAIQVYLSEFSEAAARRVMCNHEDDFKCYLSPAEHANKCKGVIDRAEEVSYRLPRTVDELEATCVLQRYPSLQDRLGEAPYANLVGDPLDGQPGQCASKCSASRVALVQIAAAYANGGKTAASKQMCENATAFGCYLDDESCSSVVDEVARLGLPSSQEGLDSHCRLRRLDLQQAADGSYDAVHV